MKMSEEEMKAAIPIKMDGRSFFKMVKNRLSTTKFLRFLDLIKIALSSKEMEETGSKSFATDPSSMTFCGQD